MSDAQARGWGDPDSLGFREKNIVTITAGGVSLPVHRTVSYLFSEFIKELVSLGYRLDATRDDWGYANRNIAGTSRKSNHAWGLAVDLNATANPATRDGAVHTNLPKNINAVAAKYGLFWGGNYSTTLYRDPMHFEFLGTPAEAVALTAKLVAANNHSVSPVKPPSRPVAQKVAIVRAGDSYWRLAERYYGSTHGNLYPVIQRANNFKALKPGMRVVIPRTPVQAKPRFKRVRVLKGDSYWRLAQRYYHNGLKWKVISRANKGRALHPGESVLIPV